MRVTPACSASRAVHSSRTYSHKQHQQDLSHTLLLALLHPTLQAVQLWLPPLRRSHGMVLHQGLLLPLLLPWRLHQQL